MALELTPLRHLLVVAQERSISRAAARLHLAQPALSRQVARLEAEVGVQLLVRTSRGVELTQAGTALVEQARRTIAQVDAAVAAARGAASRQATTVRTAFYCDAAALLMPRVVAEHRTRHPDVTVEVAQLDFRTQLRLLREEKLDVAFVRPFCDVAGLESQALLAEPVAVALPRHHPLADRASTPLSALAREQWIVLAASVVGQDAHMASVARLRSAGVEGDLVTLGADAQAGIGMVAAGLGVFPCPLSAARTAPPEVAFVPIEGWTTAIHVVWRAGPPEPVVLDFLETSRAICA